MTVHRTGSVRSPGRVPGGVGSVLAIAVPAVLLGLESSLGAAPGVLIALVSAALPAIVRPWVAGLGRALPFVPSMIGLALLASTAPPTAVPAVLAAAAGVGLVLAMARYDEATRPVRLTAVGLFVPAVGAGIALTTALLFGTSERLVGAAALLVLATVVAIAILLAEPERLARPEPAP